MRYRLALISLLAAACATPDEPAPLPATSKPCTCNDAGTTPCDAWVVVRFEVSFDEDRQGTLSEPVATKSCGDAMYRTVAVQKAAKYSVEHRDRVLKPGSEREQIELLLKFDDQKIEFWGQGK